jgi:hypothetical protein
VGFIDFLGISTLPRLENGNESLNTDSSKQQKMVLIMGYANEGPVHAFLMKTIRQLSYQESWDAIVDTLNSVANGLYSLHRRGIIHR